MRPRSRSRSRAAASYLSSRKLHRSACRLAAGLLAVSLALPASAGSNLLVNPSFESDLMNWNTVSSSVQVFSYGSPNVPSLAVSNHIGGGNRLLRDLGNNGQVEQTVSLAGVPQGMNLRVGGYFGGISTDAARMVVRFLDGGGGEIALRTLDPVTEEHRNSEAVLMLREEILAIPAGAVSAAIRVEFINNCCGGAFGAADALFVESVSTPVVPGPLPLDTQLLNNPGFEDGWANSSPLTLTDVQGWEGTGSTSVVKPYSNQDSSVPPVNVSTIIGGQGNLVSDLGANGSLHQSIDVRGNLPQFATGSLDLLVSAYLGSVGLNDDASSVAVTFLDASGSPISSVPLVGPVTRADRNSESVVLRREQRYRVPIDCSYIDIELVLANACCGPFVALADNISAVLTAAADPVPVVRNVNLVNNPGFEDGDLPGSPLELNNPDGWFGVATARVVVKPYGQDSSLPSTTFAGVNGLGGSLLNDFDGDALFRQVLDLSGDQADIAAGKLAVHAEAWLGGFEDVDDWAELRVRFVDVVGTQVGALQILPPVTAADRGNVTTLILREADFLVPPQASRMEVDLLFTNECCGQAYGLVDGIEVVVFVDGCVPYCAALPNATGEPAILGCDGDPASSLVLTSFPVPNTPGQFFFGPTMLAGNPFGDGLLCVGGAVLRILPFAQAGMMMQPPNSVIFPLNYAAPYASGLNGTKNFQYWFRSGLATGQGFNTSTALSITF